MSKNIFFICCTILLFILLQTNPAKANFNSVYSSDGINVWAAGTSGNVFKSSDGGNTWQSFYVGTSDFNSVFVIGLNIWLASQNGNIVRSTDGGNNWLTTSGFPAAKSLFFMDISNGFFAGGSGTIYKTINGGANWMQVTSGTGNNLNCVKFSDANNGAVCGTNGTVIITTNGGSLWTVLNTTVTKELLSIDMKANTIITSGVDATVLKSTNNGNSWSIIDYKITTQSDVNSVFMQDANTYFSIGGGGFIRKSTDGGITFSFGINPMLAPLSQIYFYDINKGWAVSPTTNAVIRTTDGGNNWLFPAGLTQTTNWVLKISGAFSSFGNIFALNHENKKEIFVALSNKIYRSLDFGENWIQISTVSYGDLATSLIVSEKDSSKLLISINTSFSGQGKVMRSTDYGATWNATFSGNISTDSKPLCFDPNHPDTIYLAPNDSVIFRSTNFGLNWVPASPLIINDICILKVLENHSNILICGSKQNYPSYNVTRLLRSSDYGQNWTIIDTFHTTINNFNEIPDIGISNMNDSTLFISIFNPAGGVRKSTDFGLNGAFINNDPPVWGIDIAKDDPNVLCYANAATISSAFISVNSGLNSFSISPLPNANNSILYYNRNNLFAQVESSIYKLSILYVVPIGIKQISSQVPKAFLLNQNYPNPFNPSSKITYQLPTAGFVKLTVFDLLGKEVSVIVQEHQQPGTYEVDFDASNQSSGVYFYKLQTEKYSDTKKMIIIK